MHNEWNKQSKKKKKYCTILLWFLKCCLVFYFDVSWDALVENVMKYCAFFIILYEMRTTMWTTNLNSFVNVTEFKLNVNVYIFEIFFNLKCLKRNICISWNVPHSKILTNIKFNNVTSSIREKSNFTILYVLCQP